LVLGIQSGFNLFPLFQAQSSVCISKKPLRYFASPFNSTPEGFIVFKGPNPIETGKSFFCHAGQYPIPSMKI